MPNLSDLQILADAMNERMRSLEEKIEHIYNELTRQESQIHDMLAAHTAWCQTRDRDMAEKYAPKWIVKAVACMSVVMLTMISSPSGNASASIQTIISQITKIFIH